MGQKRALRKLGALLLTAPLLFMTGCGRELIVLNSAGPVGQIESNLILLSTVLCLIVVVPVMLLLWFIVHRYRDTPDNKAPYRPEFSESLTLEVIWWGIPVVIVAILAVFTVQKTFALTKPPVKSGPPLTIQVISLNWKWLFLYPDQQIATVNYCQIPANRTVEFVLTANSPINSFWIPQLGGQEYSMPGMAMRLWLQADKPGVYFGTGANFTGEGFAHMRFNVTASSDAQFNGWVQQIKQTAPALTMEGYHNLVQPHVSQEAAFSAYPSGIFMETVNQEGGMYMKSPKSGQSGTD